MKHFKYVNIWCLPEMYVSELKSGQCDGKATPTIVKETPGTAYVDGRNAIGTVSI